jgi:hypothetical protein
MDLRTVRLAIRLEATTATGPCTHRKSRAPTIHLHGKRKGAWLGGGICRAVLVQTRSRRPISPRPKKTSKLGKGLKQSAGVQRITGKSSLSPAFMRS